ncbi:hypothetical protein MN0502_17140 [Arthrobacter sp. MN05-02]|nr:hypothetical protein MN0502_17140 [Arthrobacter sp. MN05-02]
MVVMSFSFKGRSVAGCGRLAMCVGIFLVGDVLAPGHDLALAVRFVNGGVGHEAVGGGAVPVLFVGSM